MIEILAETQRPRKYWSDLKKKLLREGSELSEKIRQLKMKASDGKSYKKDVLDTENILRLIQSILSPKAEPFKLRLAMKESKKPKIQSCLLRERCKFISKKVIPRNGLIKD